MIKVYVFYILSINYTNICMKYEKLLFILQLQFLFSFSKILNFRLPVFIFQFNKIRYLNCALIFNLDIYYFVYLYHFI